MTDETVPLICGIVMPISGIDDYTESHWQDVREILSDAIEEAGFDPHLVSDANEVGIIQKRIIQNLYDNPMVVCDVSAKNPNVMFELGMRLAFDRPTIIVKDDKTSYSFDTAPVEHLVYPRDLRFSQIVDFKASLAEKIRATNDKAITDKEYTTFLKHFGTFKVAELKTEVVPQEELILEELRSLRSLIVSSRATTIPSTKQSFATKLCLGPAAGVTSLEDFLSEIRKAGFAVQDSQMPNGHVHIRFEKNIRDQQAKEILELAGKHAKKPRWMGSVKSLSSESPLG